MFASPMNFRAAEIPHLTCKDHIASWVLEGGEHSKLKMGASLLWALCNSRNKLIFSGGSTNIQAIINNALFWYNMDVSSRKSGNPH